MLLQGGKFEEALLCLDRALELTPRRQSVLVMRSLVLNTLHRFEESASTCALALEADPLCVAALVNLGVALNGLGRPQDALIWEERALSRAPDSSVAWNCHGRSLLALSRLEEAFAACSRALQLDTSNADAANNCAMVCMRFGRFEEGLEYCRRALAVRPEFGEAHFNAAMCQLTLGRYDSAWMDYSHALAHGLQYQGSRVPPNPHWTGTEDMRGRSIMIYEPTGLGDAILMLRYVPLLVAKGARVLLSVPKPLRSLVEGVAGLHQAYEFGESLPPTDFHCVMTALPYLFRTTLESIPASIPYVRVNTGNARQWREELAGRNARLVALCWRGSPQYAFDRERSIALSALLPILSVPGTRFVSLQKELTDKEQSFVKDFPAFVHPAVDFTGGAEIIAGADLVISVDTAWAHCAGALGRPLWIMMPFAPYWAWLTEREDSPWYPTARLFRQRQNGDWQGVVARLADALSGWTGVP
jgi:Flp pilus assembly protein TadD